MKELKYKAWDKEREQMSKAFQIHETFVEWDDERIPLPVQGVIGNPTRFELLEYTTLKAKNGIEIFDGDILSYQDQLGRVIWNRNRWEWVYGKKEHQYTGFASLESDSFEFICHSYNLSEEFKRKSWLRRI